MSSPTHALALSCEDRPGIVAAVTGCLFSQGANITEAQQFDDEATGMFFARIAFSLAPGSEGALRRALAPVAAELAMDWQLIDLSRRPRLLILVSKFDHCLADLLYRWRIGELNADIVGIVANHPRSTYRHHDFDGIPFDHLPVDANNKEEQETALWHIVGERSADLVILARYMQILSNELSARLSGRCINIHHSFLPGFKGAKPYHQAHALGVKLIGATAHYVTEDLDEGPIIEQDVERVTHGDTPDALIRKGRDIERRVLARAVAWHLEGRVLRNDKKTVVFRD